MDDRRGRGDRPGDGPNVEFDDEREGERLPGVGQTVPSGEQVDGAAEDAGPGDMPEGATPRVPRTTGDPLATAGEDEDGRHAGR